MGMCDWRKGERTLMGHLWYCYPRSSRYLLIVVTLILMVSVLDLWLEVTR